MFAMKFLRRLANTGGAMAVGAEGVALLSVIATQEDACRYAHAVNFWNHQLAAMVGLRDERALRTVRDRCVRAGWLAYDPGSKSTPASYFCVNPASVNDVPDYTSSETSRNPVNNRLLSGQNPPESSENVSTSSPMPFPNPIPLLSGGEPAETAPGASAPDPLPKPPHYARFEKQYQTPKPDPVALPFEETPEGKACLARRAEIRAMRLAKESQRA